MAFILDPCGIICLVFTYVALFYAEYVVTQWIIIDHLQDSPWSPVHMVVFNTIFFMLVMAHLKAVFYDPGKVPLPQSRMDFSDIYSEKTELDSNGWSTCGRCETYRPPRAHHCRICKRCIRRMDHHCPWINNCVGEKNQKYFLQFLFYVGILSLYSIALVIGTWIVPCKGCVQNAPEAQTKMLHSILLLLESSLFGLFVVAIMVDQLHAIVYDEGAIQAVQSKRGDIYSINKPPKMVMLAEVCGRGHPLMWLLPCTSLNIRRYDTPLLTHDV